MKMLSTTSAVVVALVAGSALAADLPSRKAAPSLLAPEPVFSWTGFYGGLNIGGGWGAGYTDFNQIGGGVANFWGQTGSNSGGVVGGGQAGYNYQFSPLFVVGLETDFQGSGVGSHNQGYWGVGQSLNWYGTVRARAGVTPLDPHFLFFATGGFAYGEIENRGYWSSNETRTGWTVGGGVEWAFLPNWSAKVEYDYHDIGAGSQGQFYTYGGVGAGNEGRTRFHTVTVGVNYHFNFGGSAPVVAKY